ncbi:alpha/beta hydrolase fold domain-containing protein [Mycolicibacterium septicum]|uniref:alpha/beta hydrolase fold domain-containing protein n=1 Tax=Mycolicibacterium septicum TaxID=98668 RepID=UPI001FCAE88C|nr:alpha/beta hydrolase fold domain-containing protein [Mycolicibacterium septicum]
MSIAMLRSMFDEWHLPTKEPEAVTYRSDVIAGVEGIWALPLGADTSTVILYNHGGGFAVGSAASHRKLAGHLATAPGTSAFVIDYRRAPEHPFPAQIGDATAVYRALLDSGVAPERIVTAGDSAGGNLAIAMVHALRDDGTPLRASTRCTPTMPDSRGSTSAPDRWRRCETTRPGWPIARRRPASR